MTSPQLARFLRFVVSETLAGNAERIKEFSIAVGPLRRDQTFDPKDNPIVRVEATRMRRALELYYAGTGRHDPVMIELPRGTYVPAFTLRASPQNGHSFAGSGACALTRREIEVLTWAARGKSAIEIGDILQLGKRTVDQYAFSAARKVGAVNRTHAVALAVRDRLIEL